MPIFHVGSSDLAPSPAIVRGFVVHRGMGYERDRGSASDRGYDRRWARAAAEFKRRYPWCLGCAAIGVRTLTDVADHIIPHRGDRSKFDGPVQPACAWHHNAIKPILEARYERGEITAAALRLDSPEAQAMTRAKRRQPIGLDGWPA